MFLGKDMLIFNGTTFKQKDYDMKRLSRVEGVLFLVDAAACLARGAFQLEMGYQMVCLGIVFVTLLFHGRNFSSGKYKVKHGNKSRDHEWFCGTFIKSFSYGEENMR